MFERSGLLLGAAAAATFTLVAVSYLPAGVLLRYAVVSARRLSTGQLLLAPFVVASALLFEALVRGLLYGALRVRLPAGASAPVVAALGAVVLSALRLTVFSQPRVPAAILVAQAFLVEAFLGLGLAWLALGTGSTAPGGLALGGIWLLRSGVVATFHGGAVPLLEMIAAILAAVSVAAVLNRPLAPHREAVMEA